MALQILIIKALFPLIVEFIPPLFLWASQLDHGFEATWEATLLIHVAC